MLVIALALTLGMLASCGNGDDDTTPDTPAQTQAPADDTTDNNNENDADVDDPPAVDSEFATHLTISIGTVDAHNIGRDDITATRYSPVLQYVMERFNVSFEWYPLEWGTFLETTQLWLAGGISPDVFFMDVHPTRYGEFYRNATQDGFFRPYNLDNNPNLRAAFEAGPPAAQAFMINGNLYTWPGITDLTTRLTPRRIQGFVYRRDWAEAVGHATADSIYTYEQWIAMTQAVQAENPGNVPGGPIGLVSLDWAMPTYWPIAGLAPHLITYVSPDGGPYVWGPTLPESMDLFRELNRLYHDGIVWEDQVLGNVDPDLWFNGNMAFAMTEPNVTFSRIGDVLWHYVNDQGIEPTEELMAYHGTYTIGFGIIETPGGDIIARLEGGVWSQQGMAATISEENAVRWEAIMDFLVSDEGYFTRNFGIRGQHWDFDANGNVELMWEERPEGGLINPLDDYNQWPFNRMAGNSDGIMIMYAPEAQRPVQLGHYMRLINTIMNDPRVREVPFDVDIAYFTGETFMEIGGLGGDLSTQIPVMMVANPDNLEAMWQEWLDARTPLIQPVLDEINAALR